MTHQLDADDMFIHRVQLHCAEQRLNFFLIDPPWVEVFLEKLRAGRVRAKVLLNMHSEHHDLDDPFHRLVDLADELGTQVIDQPAIAAAAFDKASLHSRLALAGFTLPFTLIVPYPASADFVLPPEDRRQLGTTFVIKPSLGYGKKGVILDANSAQDIERSAREWKDPKYLLQQRVVPRSLGNEPAYFRAFFAFDSVWICWWNCYTDRYRTVTPDEVQRFHLEPIEQTARRLARFTGMNFFSTELAQVETGEFYLIDYLNDQCHMLAQSANPAIGVPDEVVAEIARRLVEGAAAMMRSRT